MEDKLVQSHKIFEEEWCEKSVMSLADWRWAANMGFWDPGLRCWNESMGGMSAYLKQRDDRRSKRLRRNSRPTKQPTGQNDTYTEARIEQMSNASDTSRQELDSALTTGSRLLLIMTRHGWGHHAVRRYWNGGYQADSVMRLFHDLPLPLRSVIREVLDSAQVCADAGLQHHATNAKGYDEVSPLHPEPALGEWEQDLTHAFVERRFDPATQACIGTAANTRAAALLGMRLNELLARLNQGDLPLPLMPLDAVAVFLHSLGTSRDRVATKTSGLRRLQRPWRLGWEQNRSWCAAMAQRTLTSTVASSRPVLPTLYSQRHFT